MCWHNCKLAIKSMLKVSYKKPREKIAINTPFCRFGKDNLLSSGRGKAKIAASVRTCRIPIEYQKCNRASQSL
jgi:hypothetical protein